MHKDKTKSAVILCGGRGRRLGDVGKEKPKTLMKVQGKPILWYLLKTLKKNNYNQVVLALGFKHQLITKYIKKNYRYFKGLEIICLNTGVNSSISKRVFNLRNQIKSEEFLLLNSDTIFNFNLEKLYKDKIKNKIDFCLLSVSSESDFGCIILKGSKAIGFKRDIKIEKIFFNDIKKYGLVNSGICFMNKKIFNFKFDKFYNFENEFYPILIKKLKTKIYSPKGFWTAMDNTKQISLLNSKKNYLMYNSIRKIKQKLEKV